MTDISTSETHIGQRLAAEMQSRGMSAAQVAKLFGVKAPSVYDWINFGRIAKKHIPKLVEVFGHTAEYWIDGSVTDASKTNAGLPPSVARLARVLEGKSEEEIDRIAQALELLLLDDKRQEKRRAAGRRILIRDGDVDAGDFEPTQAAERKPRSA